MGVWVGRFKGTGRAAYVGAQAAEPLLIDLFSHPRLRGLSAPAQPDVLTVSNPLILPKEKQDRLVITRPANAEQFICVQDHAAVHIDANRTQGIQWFLNGRLLDHEAKRLSLAPGQYELRCIDTERGDSSSVRFDVTPMEDVFVSKKG
jgi:membrane carboxypeptidase/penicillin-binding protein PbpC